MVRHLNNEIILTNTGEEGDFMREKKNRNTAKKVRKKTQLIDGLINSHRITHDISSVRLKRVFRFPKTKTTSPKITSYHIDLIDFQHNLYKRKI